LSTSIQFSASFVKIVVQTIVLDDPLEQAAELVFRIPVILEIVWDFGSVGGVLHEAQKQSDPTRYLGIVKSAAMLPKLDCSVSPLERSQVELVVTTFRDTRPPPADPYHCTPECDAWLVCLTKIHVW
jgi:hypothetical protein